MTCPDLMLAFAIKFLKCQYFTLAVMVTYVNVCRNIKANSPFCSLQLPFAMKQVELYVSSSPQYSLTQSQVKQYILTEKDVWINSNSIIKLSHDSRMLPWKYICQKEKKKEFTKERLRSCTVLYLEVNSYEKIFIFNKI